MLQNHDPKPSGATRFNLNCYFVVHVTNKTANTVTVLSVEILLSKYGTSGG